MVSTDPIADMFTRIRNAIAIDKNEVTMPYSKLKEKVANILAANGFIKEALVDGEGISKYLLIVINDEQSNSTITEIARLSRPGRRLYVGADKIPTVKRGRGIVIVSTSNGVMTGQEARAQKVGGELLGQVY